MFINLCEPISAVEKSWYSGMQSNPCRYHYQALPRPGYLSFCSFPTNNVTTFLFAFAKLALIVSYFYICDR